MIRFLVITVLMAVTACATTPVNFEDATEAYDRKDYAATLKIVNPLADRGDAGALYLLGKMYMNGEGVARDAKRGRGLIMKAAEQGYVDAQYDMGVAYAYGTVVKKDYKESFKWLNKAADQNHIKAQHLAGLAYYLGIGIPQNHKQAAVQFEKAAARHFPASQAMLATMLMNGDAMDVDLERAYLLASESAMQGYDRALDIKEDITAKMTPEQLKKATEALKELSLEQLQ